ncbi:M56 family metallopeptidase [Parvularcula sp. IMCC14364]|uniref:M56 family metallopeptidase n=1 Tax=Parvularcula sp. IMCC14364 TaxID=3067902 RepID=UPI002741A802|nr:M56 family metallopeptidase [Parvularcula sp. IMCC14364]
MTLLVAAIVFTLVWSALIWGCATSDARSNTSYANWPAYWRVNAIVACLPALAIFAFAALPAGTLPDISGLLSLAGANPEKAPKALAALPAMDVAAVTGQSILPPMLRSVTMIYALGAAFFLFQFVLGKLKTGHIIREATYDATRDLWVTDRPMSPFAVGGLHPKVVFPDNLLAALTQDQIDMVLRHERAHITHKDPLWADFFYLLQALFWFSPFVRDLIKRWQLAVELRSDTVALADAAPEERKNYAESLLTAIRIPVEAAPCSAAAFSQKNLRSEKMRIKNIINGDFHMQSTLTGSLRLLLAASVLGLIGCASAAGVSSATADAGQKEEDVNVWVHKTGDHGEDLDIKKEVHIMKMADGERIVLGYEDLSAEERARIDEQLARAEEKLAKAMADMDISELEMEGAEQEIRRSVEIRLQHIEKDGERLTEEERYVIEKQIQEAAAEMAEARIEIEIAREEIREAREEVSEQRRDLAEEK